MKLKEYLKGKLNKKELAIVPSSFDIVGDIAIFIEMPSQLKKKEKLIAEAVMKLHKNIKVVCKKVRKYSGKYRISKLTMLAGEKRTETMHIENGTRLLVDVEKVYFSPRSGTERQRIVNLVKPYESVLVMFAGCGPYTIQIAKKARKVTAIEANPIAHTYALKNIKLNKIRNAVVLKGDVKKIIPNLDEKFDRIVMPLPKTAIKHLKEVYTVAKKGTVIHLYSFAKEEEFGNAKKDILTMCKKLKKNCKILRVIKTGDYAPRTFRICIDILIQ